MADISRDDLVCVDKTLVCKGFWDGVSGAARICLPRRSGKTFNLQLIRLFFSSLPELDCLGVSPSNTEIDYAALGRSKRESFFECSLLKELHADFFADHFMQHSVIYISLDKCDGNSFGAMVKLLCEAIACTARRHLGELRYSDKPVSSDLQEAERHLRDSLQLVRDVCGLSADKAAQYETLPSTLFSDLSRFVFLQNGRYILLLDEYDTPLLALLQSSWDKVDKEHAHSMFERLFQAMFKGNIHMDKGLITGVFELPTIKIGSGPNGIQDIHLVPLLSTDIRNSRSISLVRHSRGGLDALTDSFWFNAIEVRDMLVNCTAQFDGFDAYYDDVMGKIREFYNGYYIGRFSGKFNPWSACSFLKQLCRTLQEQPVISQGNVTDAIESSAQRYWVRTGSAKLIRNQCIQHRVESTSLLEELTLEYQERKYLPVEVQLAPSTTPPISVALGDASFVDLYFEGNRFSKGAFLSICLQAGYLTRRTAQTVCIPNEELFLVWRNLLGELVFGEDFTQGPNELKRGQIVGELWRNNPKRLCDLVTSSHMVLVGHTNFKEKQFANHAANSFKVAALFGALSHPRGIATLITNTQFLREVPTGDGRCDMVLWLDSTTNAARVFGVVIEFKLIDYRKRDD
ncbi:hypothetical protein IWW57_003063, partial [Coemansia sp. S610]